MYIDPTTGEKARPRSSDEKYDVKEPKYLWEEVKMDHDRVLVSYEEQEF